jgi:soluble lytic murein transglycosylase-like protein
VTRLAPALVVAAACLAGAACGSGSGGSQSSPTPPASTAPASLASRLTAIDARLRAAIRAWRDADPGLVSPPPAGVLREAAAQRAIVHELAPSPTLARETIARLPARLATAIRLDVAAAVDLRRLSGPPSGKPVRLHLVKPLPAGVLLADYRRAEARYGVRWQVLAAVNLIESAFGRVVNRSSAGAQGPMQFMPATWRAYGLGGNVHDARDAILGAANYLHASGAPADERRALFAYNRSTLYVAAVLAYARQMTRDPLGFATYYAWEASLPSVL